MRRPNNCSDNVASFSTGAPIGTGRTRQGNRASSSFDVLTTALLLKGYREQTLPEGVLVALLAGVGVSNEPPNALLWELVAAYETGRRKDLAPLLDASGLRSTGRPILLERVTCDAHQWAPDPAGKPAIITPFFEDGRLVDLVATSIETRASRTRMGVCTCLGVEHIDHARESGEALWLYSDPMEWLQHDRQGACVIDWRAARFDLADLNDITCSNDKLAIRVDRAFRQPVTMPTLFVPEATNHHAI